MYIHKDYRTIRRTITFLFLTVMALICMACVSGFLNEAHASGEIAKMNGVEYALFKQKSPSCGKGKIYDGTFTSAVIDGLGMTSRLFIQNGIRVYADTEFEEFRQQIDK